ncbi:hypothetical protein D9611_012874 [Ephemerocybe angulata]|uniref:Uncharacterized protein n=1 Tax=Ephemerocybe angulata TaxID=980116 RepID=A0A8H5BB31_9AGAR|nr:hypothetical protein D9611_012874 [Tulosesus angulatus]
MFSRSFARLALAASAALSLCALSASAAAAGPNQCITFDASWNLLAFNFDGKDYTVPSDGLSSSTPAAAITSTGSRPPFDAPSSPPLCYLSQFFNAVYVLNADASDPTSVYMYDITKKSWSKQATTLPGKDKVPLQSFDITRGFGAILDRDTNVFYALTGGEMLSLNLGEQKAATGEAVVWNDVGEMALAKADVEGSGAQGYESPTMALAQNHIHFIGGVPGLKEGDARVFVIHFSYLQPEVQSYGNFPTQHGKTASFFKDTGVQTQFAYIPDDGSATYVVDVISNTTTTLPAPSLKDPGAQYAASPSALVQLSSEGGKISFLSYDQDAKTAKGDWTAITGVPAATNVPGGSSSSSSSATTTTGGTSGSGASGNKTSSAAGGKATGGASAAAGKGENGAVGRGVGVVLGGVMAVLGVVVAGML